MTGAKEAVQAHAERRSRRIHTDTRWLISLVALLVIELAYFSLAVSGFWGGGSGLLQSGEEFIDIGVMALGVMFVIFAGDIDLSCGSMASFVGIVMGELSTGGMNIWLAVVIALAIAAMIGAVQGVIITFFRIESLLVTLASSFILSSAASALGGGSPPYGFPQSFQSVVGTGTIGPIPNQLIVFVVLAVIVTLVVHRTGFGRALVLVGHNRDAASYAGVRVSRTRIRAFVLSALFAGVAGVIICGYYNAARDDVGDALLLPAITVVVLGGVDIFGGSGRVTGVIAATFVLGFITVGLLTDGVSQLVTTMVTGVVLLVCLLFKGALSRNVEGGSVRDRLRARLAPPHRTASGTS